MSQSTPSITIHAIKSLPEYINLIEQLADGEYLYRGQGNDHRLEPKVARLSPRRDNIESTEKQMLLDLKRRAGTWLGNGLLQPQNDWDWLALAQHHGMATRLLDWSDNPLVALWFSVEKVFKKRIDKGGRDVQDDTPVVWIFQILDKDLVPPDEKDSDPFSFTRTRVFRPNHISPRIVAQSGWFTAHAYRRQNGPHGFISFEKNTLYTQRLTKVKIDVACVGQLRAKLRTLGFHSGTLYPSIEGVCADITERHTCLSDENVSQGAPLDDAPREPAKVKLIVTSKPPVTSKVPPKVK